LVPKVVGKEQQLFSLGLMFAKCIISNPLQGSYVTPGGEEDKGSLFQRPL